LAAGIGHVMTTPPLLLLLPPELLLLPEELLLLLLPEPLLELLLVPPELLPEELPPPLPEAPASSELDADDAHAPHAASKTMQAARGSALARVAIES
jgi:hypothetical protein